MGVVLRQALHIRDLDESVSLRPLGLVTFRKSALIAYSERSRLLVACEVSLVIGHIKHCESSIRHVSELLVGFVKLVVWVDRFIQVS